MTTSKPAEKTAGLRVQRVIPAPPERVFHAWTDPDELAAWWGPKGVRCLSAEVDLRIGGGYRIGNELPDGSVLWISGVFNRIERPHLLQYSWTVETRSSSAEQVTVHFEQHPRGTLLTVVHELIPSIELRAEHERGWFGCLDGLEKHLA